MVVLKFLLSTCISSFSISRLLYFLIFHFPRFSLSILLFFFRFLLYSFIHLIGRFIISTSIIFALLLIIFYSFLVVLSGCGQFGGDFFHVSYIILLSLAFFAVAASWQSFIYIFVSVFGSLDGSNKKSSKFSKNFFNFPSSFRLSMLQ